MVPEDSFPAGYQAARSGAAVIDRFDRGRLIVSGADRASYLHGLLTNDVAALKAGQGCYAAYLTPQGRMIADLFVYELGDVMLVTLSTAVKDTVLARLNQFIFTEDVTVGDVTDTFTQVAVIGPDAARRLGSAGVLQGTSSEALAALPEHGNARVRFAEQPAIVARVTDTGEPGFDVYVERPQAAALAAALSGAGVVTLDDETAEAIRIEAGIPRFGRDMDEQTIPLEAGIESRAISFTKGCYVGQEVIIRVLHRGHGRVARKLSGLVLDGESTPLAGAPVHADDRDIGHVTSAAWSPALKKPIALAYLQRDFLTAGTTVSVDDIRAVVTALPFVGQ
jgi:folate-binding protein YgfZ